MAGIRTPSALRILIGSLLVVGLVGCASPPPPGSDAPSDGGVEAEAPAAGAETGSAAAAETDRNPIGDPEAPGILFMRPDIELHLLTAGGVLEPRADWTESAVVHTRDILGATFEDRGLDVVDYRGTEDPERADHHRQLTKLNELVGNVILQHEVLARQGGTRLPTLEDRFDWSLGTSARSLGEEHGTRYGVFVFIRDSYASAGRQAVMAASMLVGAAMGVAIVPQGGVQIGFVSIVDFETGEILWFNHLARGSGDLRTLEAAQNTFDVLLRDLPF